VNDKRADHRLNISLAAKNNFDDLPDADFSSQSGTATFKWYPNQTQPIALIKIFTGGTAENLYRQEIGASSRFKSRL
jgi:hypothetical protein